MLCANNTVMEKEVEQKENVHSAADNEIDSIQKYFGGINTGKHVLVLIYCIILINHELYVYKGTFIIWRVLKLLDSEKFAKLLPAKNTCINIFILIETYFLYVLNFKI